MSIQNIAAGLVLAGAVGAGCVAWAGSDSFIVGACVFIVGALIAGFLKKEA